MNDWTAYLAIGVAGLTSLMTVWLLASGPRQTQNRRLDSGSDNRRRLDDIDRKVTLLNRYVEEQIPRVVADSMRSHVTSSITVVANDTPSVLGKDAKVVSATAEQAAVVREIAHSLNTPLAQIEASVLSIRGTNEEQHRKLNGILEGVRICKSFLAAFREGATLARDSQAWSPDSLRSALRAATALYAAPDGNRPKVEVHMPRSVPGYSNNFVVAVLLPLLQNAVEAAPAHGTVSVHADDTGDGVRLRVSNDTVETGLPDSIYHVGFSTKEGHDGLGLPSVRRLLASRDARISHLVADGRVTFTIDLPRGRREY
ncbi:ATP-binding protein [Streptomyces collinus]|uniref:ATP-binding protein n=1 Tax=Streptomyces collinus TaxID=42684 RepID=UPI003820BB63